MIPRHPQAYTAPAETPRPAPTAEPFSLVERIAMMALVAGALLMVCVAISGTFDGRSLVGLATITVACLVLALHPREENPHDD